MQCQAWVYIAAKSFAFPQLNSYSHFASSSKVLLLFELLHLQLILAILTQFEQLGNVKNYLLKAPSCAQTSVAEDCVVLCFRNGTKSREYLKNRNNRPPVIIDTVRILPTNF